MEKVLIVGAGAQGGPCAAILAGEESIGEIRLGDINLDFARTNGYSDLKCYCIIQ